MSEISSKQSELLLHERVKKLEREKEKKEKRIRDEMNKEKELKDSLESNRQMQEFDDFEVEREDAIRSSLIEELIEESEQSSSPLPSSVIKLLHHLKGIYMFFLLVLFLILQLLMILILFVLHRLPVNYASQSKSNKLNLPFTSSRSPISSVSK